tara:strand:- start:171 stop:662 length:492 start_codon:yes stop_codon:yes gene_type:complete
MKEQKISISTITYYKKDDIRILNACLSNWLTDPKILHFTSPKMTYPFNLKKWISLSYKEENNKTIIIKIDDWIIGHLSIKYEEDQKSAHLFHLIIDSDHLRKGLAKKLIDFAEKIIKEAKINKITLNVVRKNKAALRLYKSIGYTDKGKNRFGSIKMEKLLIK